MKIALTGAAGKAGRVVWQDLVEHGYEVAACDRVRAETPVGRTLEVDLTDFGQTLETLAGCAAVIHLAAIPAPGIATPATTFHNNMTSTLNVLEACRVLGIKRIVLASSETVLGLPFDDPPPRYAPVDEEHPLFPHSTYALSKRLAEEASIDYHRWTGASIVNLRFSNIMLESDYASFPSFQDDPFKRKWNLWGYVDARDVAQSCRKAVEVEGLGAESFIIAAADTVMETPSRDLVARAFPTTEIRAQLQGRATCLAIDKARRILGYEPKHSWRQYV